MRVFSNSGKFDRIILSAFQLGDAASIEAAMNNVTQFLSAFASTTATVSNFDFARMINEHPNLTKRFQIASKTSDAGRIIDLTKFFDGVPYSATSAEPLVPPDVLLLLREHLALPGASQTPDVDGIVQGIVRDRLSKGVTSPDNRKAKELLRAMPTLKVELEILSSSCAV